MIIKYIDRLWVDGITIFPFIFIKSIKKNNSKLLRHEKIHIKQQLEMLIIPFYIWYVLEFIFRYWQYYGGWNSAYRNMSFEREAFANEFDDNYKRQPYSWVKYLKTS